MGVLGDGEERERERCWVGHLVSSEKKILFCQKQCLYDSLSDTNCFIVGESSTHEIITSSAKIYH